MEHSQEELLRKLNRIYDEPELLKIIDGSDSPSGAESLVEASEYPSSLVREARYAAILKRDYSKTFAGLRNDIIRKNSHLGNGVENNARLLTKRFVCHWGDNERSNEFSSIGTILVTPHAFLPPLFWDYELHDEEDRLIFSSTAAIPHHERQNVRCMFTEGSRSIPVGLLLICEKCGDHYQFSRAIQSGKTFWWSRSRPIGARLHNFQGEFFSAGVHAERIRDIHQNIILRALGEKEKNLLEPYDAQYLPKATIYHLILQEQIWYPHTETESLFCKIEMRYKLPHEWRKKQNGIASLVTFPPLFINDSYGGYGSKVLVSISSAEHSCHNVEGEKEFTEYVSKMLNGAPEQIDFLLTLESFFSFKREELFFLYNEGGYDFEAPLAVSKKEPKMRHHKC